MHYQIIKAGNDNIGIVWEYRNKKTKIRKIYLPAAKNKILQRIKKYFTLVDRKPRKLRYDLEKSISDLYKGKIQKVPWFMLDMSDLTPFTKKVLKQACKIPRGKVSTYSGLATKIGKPGAARAVGTVMANNPFPIVIPCHRVIRADGTLGGFGGGLEMKKKMLKSEGVKIDSRGCVGSELRIT